MSNLLRFSVGVMLMLGASTLFALQSYPVKDNSTTKATISMTDATRIFIKQDRIKNVRGVKGAYTNEKDEENGEIYLTPHQDLPFSITLGTEQGRHYTLQLSPAERAADPIMLVPEINLLSFENVGGEKASSYELSLIHFIQHLVHRDRLHGYKVDKALHPKAYRLGDYVTFHLQTVYKGIPFIGEIYELHNSSLQPVAVNEQNLYLPGTLAVSIEENPVPPSSKTHFYRVVQHG